MKRSTCCAAILACALPLYLSSCGGGHAPEDPAQAATYYTTKTPYQPAQDPATYEKPPAGYRPVHTQLAARHGSRGLSTPKYDLSLYAIWEQAYRDDALTPLGKQLGPDIMKIIRANALLGYGVKGVTKPGYGNLSQRGIEEHRQLASRMAQRLPALFASLAAQQGEQARKLMFVSSGADRSPDSGLNFLDGLVADLPSLQPWIEKTPALENRYPADQPRQQPPGVNRFLLYFFAVDPERDLVIDPADPYFDTYRAGRDYVAYLQTPRYLNRVAALENDAAFSAAARAALERLFTREFLSKLEDGTYRFANTGSFTFTSDDGQFTATVTGDGKAAIKGITDAATMLYDLYNIAPGLRQEAGVDFTQYLPAELARVFALNQDSEKFYLSAPGFSEANGVTHRMARILVRDFFSEVDAIARGDLRHAAMLRFGHAETMLPLAAEMGIPGMSEPLPEAQLYSYSNSAWRGGQPAVG